MCAVVCCRCCSCSVRRCLGRAPLHTVLPSHSHAGVCCRVLAVIRCCSCSVRQCWARTSRRFTHPSSSQVPVKVAPPCSGVLHTLLTRCVHVWLCAYVTHLLSSSVTCTGLTPCVAHVHARLCVFMAVCLFMFMFKVVSMFMCSCAGLTTWAAPAAWPRAPSCTSRWPSVPTLTACLRSGQSSGKGGHLLYTAVGVPGCWGVCTCVDRHCALLSVAAFSNQLLLCLCCWPQPRLLGYSQG